ncbi:thermonuclease family protein [Rhizobium oryzihabitans]|jgi:endonuclease YncB( thermonuclease family)|uniref:thermonuclease family protein n=1 Tax=Rhizobium oryzihabitans TaxID=2267833 RepID=UPI001FE94D6E|nr:thermonuclease family protein [Rhizobium oryzihabitans]
MREIADGKHITCRVIDTDQYRRLVAQCFESGRDIGLAIVAAGLAETLFRYLPRQHGMNLGEYVETEQRAKAANAGMWSAEILKPSEFRRASKPAAPGRS